ncbi:MAG: type IV secretion system DNA-binding domain-containing protein [Rhodobiaceae bacterium]|nr:type IV secretion system DNA-binding domain-containing protein [Rhodobiaceae bacterium]MCC0062017.1 type IV secretion system DNA-binding domain-containing protein [Rhodobiaceae bacterium]
MNPFYVSDHLQLGASSYGGHVPLAREARRRHLYVVGQTGTGKSTLLLNLIIQDIIAGEGVAVLDPHGDLTDAILHYIPRWRANDLVYLNPVDLSRPIGFNPLSRIPDDLKHMTADGIVASFRHVWPDSWGPRLDYILTHAIRALLDIPGGTLLMLPRLLIDTRYRTQAIDRHVRDPIVRAFWLNEYAGYSDHFRTEAIAPIQNKIGKALMAPALRNMLAQPSATITPRRLIDERAILICNLSKGTLGESTAHLIGALLVTAIAQAALSRVDIDAADRMPFHLYVDEFQSFATVGFSLILSEARKYALTLTLGHQYLDQLPDNLRSAIFGNAGSILACRTGATDAPLLAREIGLQSGEAILDLPNFAAWARLLHDGIPTSPIRINLFDAPQPYRNNADRLIALSRDRFGRDRTGIEEKIARFLQS